MDYITYNVGNKLYTNNRLNFDQFKEIIITYGKGVTINNILIQKHLCYEFGCSSTFIFAPEFSTSDRCALFKLMYKFDFNLNIHVYHDATLLDIIMKCPSTNEAFKNGIYDIYKTLYECGAKSFNKTRSLTDIYQYYLGMIVLNQNNIKNVSKIMIHMINSTDFDINFRDKYGYTFIYYLLRLVNCVNSLYIIKIVKVLIDNNVNMFVKTNSGNSAYKMLNSKRKRKRKRKRNKNKIYSEIYKYLLITHNKRIFSLYACLNSNKCELSCFFTKNCGMRKFIIKRINTYL
mgnify:CR=1 FL=1